MKKILSISLVLCIILCDVCPAQAGVYSNSRDYLIYVLAIISQDPDNDVDSLKSIRICQYDDISKVWGRSDPPFEIAFMIDAHQIPDEGYIFAFEIKDIFFALVSMEGTIISIQNMTENAEMSSALVASFNSIDKSKISSSEYVMAHDYINELLMRDLALALLNWDSSALFADGDWESNKKNIWH